MSLSTPSALYGSLRVSLVDSAREPREDRMTGRLLLNCPVSLLLQRRTNLCAKEFHPSHWYGEHDLLQKKLDKPETNREDIRKFSFTAFSQGTFVAFAIRSLPRRS